MTQMIFVNLPVTDLDRSKDFYTAIGAVNDPRCTDDSAAMMSFSETISIMLLTHKRFADFTDRTIINAHSQVQVLNCLSRESREAVDAITEKARKAGAKLDPTPVQEHGFMYGRSFADPDGHIWEVMWMDMAAAEEAMSGTQTPEPV
ncbi:lactoylglutathione lyase [Maricaulis sp. W15]|uniref:VOC family protein n=1 Tax=Maricaulis sp. W15 TaxID=1772333 RepID=UPI000948EBC6|nr:lactoylglutathione lyase [Maricaulis sp. W15]OLF74078.1 lactoylglutathione lyase [Maricaulis sp. W15]